MRSYPEATETGESSNVSTETPTLINMNGSKEDNVPKSMKEGSQGAKGVNQIRVNDTPEIKTKMKNKMKTFYDLYYFFLILGFNRHQYIHLLLERDFPLTYWSTQIQCK